MESDGWLDIPEVMEHFISEHNRIHGENSLDRYGLDTGYMLSFNFNRKKEPGVQRVQLGDKVMFEGTV